MKHSVAFPHSFFLQEIQNEYSGDLNERTASDLNQNSSDAGCTRIDYIYNEEENSVICRDDGHGMDRETLINGLLTFGGSIKRGDAVGGFGKFKFVLFAQSKFEVKTLNQRCTAVGTDCDLSEGEWFPGTEIKIYFPKNWPNSAGFPDALRRVVSYSTMCPVYLNGELLPQLILGDTPLEDEFAIVREHPEKKVIVRFSGLFMFSKVSPGDKGYTVDSKGVGRDVLKQNREDFRPDTPYGEAFTKLVTTLANNRLQGLSAQMEVKANPTHKIHQGVLCFINPPDKLEKEHKTLFCIGAAIARIIGINLNKSNFGLYFGGRRGLQTGGVVFLNPDRLIPRSGNWNIECISHILRVILHECTHQAGHSDHSEEFIMHEENLWRQFWIKCPGISAILELARRYRKLFFPVQAKPIVKGFYVERRINSTTAIEDTPESWD